MCGWWGYDGGGESSWAQILECKLLVEPLELMVQQVLRPVEAKAKGLGQAITDQPELHSCLLQYYVGTWQYLL